MSAARDLYVSIVRDKDRMVSSRKTSDQTNFLAKVSVGATFGDVVGNKKSPVEGLFKFGVKVILTSFDCLSLINLSFRAEQEHDQTYN